LNTTALAHHTVTFLEDAFAPRTSMHGTLVDVYGTGLLLTGRSGIGKSEIALDLVERGHRLVADDVVLLKRKRENVIIGTGKEMFRHLMEIRGLGFIDVRNLFGIRAIRIQKRVETIVGLKLLEEIDRLDRTGLQNKMSNILGVEIPLVELPIFPGKNITVICEVIALNLHLKVYGYDTSKEFNERIMQAMQKKRLSRYLSDDTE
jgi:HPr kinase/phosphorylase